MNSRGEVAFYARLVRAAGGEGIFLARRGRTLKVAVEGDRVAGAGTITGFGKHPVPALNEAGSVAFHASLAGGRAVEGVFLAGPGRPPRAVVLSGAAAKGVTSGTVAALEAPALNDRGQVAVLATVQRGRDTIDAIYLWSTAGLVKIVAHGDPAPIGGSFAGLGPPSLNNQGLVAFAAIVDGGSALGGLFIAGPTVRPRKILATGDDSPGGGYFARFSDRVSLNDASQVAFHALVQNGPSPGGIFLTAGDAPTLVAAVGAEAPGGGRFANFGPWPAVAVDGRVAFVAALDRGGPPVGVFVSAAAGTHRVVAAGQSSPAGVLASFGLYPSVSISPTHAVAFTASPTAGAPGADAVLVAEPAAGR